MIKNSDWKETYFTVFCWQTLPPNLCHSDTEIACRC